MTYNESIKISNYKWRENNREKFNEYMREYQRENVASIREKNKICYMKHSDQRRENRKNRYYLEKELT